MSFEAAISALGLGELFVDQAFLAEVVMLAVTTLLFLCSIIVCAMAFRAAGSAHRARREALDLAVEVRHLTAQVEKATTRRRSEPAPEATGDYSGTEETAPQDDDEATAAHGKTLEEAKEAATVPSALLRNFVRRR